MELPEYLQGPCIADLNLEQVAIVNQSALIRNPDTAEVCSLDLGAPLLDFGELSLGQIGVMAVAHLGSESDIKYFTDLSMIEPGTIGANSEERGEGHIAAIAFMDEEGFAATFDDPFTETEVLEFHDQFELNRLSLDVLFDN